jgi:hypothetical protein
MKRPPRKAVEIARGIVVDARVRFGQPTIKGTRVPVSVLLDELAAGSGIRRSAGNTASRDRMFGRRSGLQRSFWRRRTEWSRAGDSVPARRAGYS